MSDQIRGKWPGGPSGVGQAKSLGRTPRIESVGDLADRGAERSVNRKRRNRGRRVVGGFAVSFVIAGALGWAIGKGSHSTAVEIVAAEQERISPSFDLSSEINRTLLELWRMEDVEYMRNSR